MNRVASTTLLLGGAALLATWLVPPAGSSPSSLDNSAETGASQDQAPPALAAVNAQVDRLRDRLAVPADFPEPRRDPFNFGDRRESPPAVRIPLPAIVPDLPAPILPKLVAILSDTVNGSVVRTAVLSVGDDVQFAKLGESVGRLRVSVVTSDAVTLTDGVSNLSFGLSLQ